jgi:anthranilate synthase component 1
LIHQLAIEARFDLLDLHTLNPRRYPHLLESCSPGPQGRFDILFAFPANTLVLDKPDSFDFLSSLDAHWKAAASGHSYRGSLPFHGGWFLYLSYELAAQIEPTLRLPADVSALPVASATRMPAAVVHDRDSGQRWIVAEEQRYASTLMEDIERLGDRQPCTQFPACRLQEDPPLHYLNAVRRILGYIREGDVFQVNLSRQWQADWPAGGRVDALYRRLRKTNPGPFNGLATWADNAILSSSPERLLAVRGNRVQTRPIAGTRPRAGTLEADKAFSDELLDHPKERAEHIMLIDLERNDLGRIAVPGTVEVSELMSLESYATVHHIVSNVEAVVRPEITPGQLIAAVFPGGTITGCPKVRCMEIIAELEGSARGAYTGSMGYLNHDGSMDLNILIRTMVKSGERLSFRAGAGIVNDSDPQRELDETRAKAAGMLRAMQEQVA